MLTRSTALFCVALALACALSQAKIVRTSDYANTQLALEACGENDVLIVNGGTPAPMSNPPRGLQVIGGSAQWNLTQDVHDIVFFKHTPLINQSGGVMRRCLFTNLGSGSKFTGLDSCLFIGLRLDYRANPQIEIDGFLRATTMLFTHYMGSSVMGLNAGQVQHRSTILINATDPAGDGSGSFFANIVTHSQGDWTPVHIVNGRRITVAHINSEYTEWADAYVKIENGVECALVHHTPGGRLNSWRETMRELNDGTVGYAGLNTRNGMWQVGGQANMIVGGVNYLSFRNMVTTWTMTDIALRDPHFCRWNAKNASGVNLAPSMRNFGFGDVEMGGVGAGEGAKAFVMSSVAQCTTAFVDAGGSPSTSGLKSNALPAGPKLLRPFTTMFPRLRLDDAGPGEDFTGKSGAEIVAALKDKKEIYLGPGTYDIPETINSGAIWGAGMDQTVLRFPSGIRCLEVGSNAYNLTIEGGTVGWAQSRKWNATDENVMLVRFRGQSDCGVTLGNAQQNFVALLEFEDCPTGVATCHDEIPCGEDDTPGGSSMIDKVNFYCCSFKNISGTGAGLGIGNNGFVSFIGCSFENCARGIQIRRTRGTNGKCEGHYVAASDFKDCGEAIDIYGSCVVQNCSIVGASGGVGISGDEIEAIISCSITNCNPAISVDGWAVISDITSDGSIERSQNTWIGASTFSNVQCPDGAYYGTTDMSAYVSSEKFVPDQTPPTKPTNVTATENGNDVIVTWDPAQDPESGILQYIVTRNGGPAGRTNFNFAGYAHYQQVAPDGMGTYREKTVFVDKNNAGKGNTYDVIAVNCARIKSDNSMDLVMMFPYNRFAKPRGEEMYVLSDPGDTIEVPQGLPFVPATMKPYLAVRYPEETATSVARERQARKPAIAANARRMARSGAVKVYDIKGRMIARIQPDQFGTWRTKIASTMKRSNGIFVLHLPDGRVQTISLTR